MSSRVIPSGGRGDPRRENNVAGRRPGDPHGGTQQQPPRTNRNNMPPQTSHRQRGSSQQPPAQRHASGPSKRAHSTSSVTSVGNNSRYSQQPQPRQQQQQPGREMRVRSSSRASSYRDPPQSSGGTVGSGRDPTTTQSQRPQGTMVGRDNRRLPKSSNRVADHYKQPISTKPSSSSSSSKNAYPSSSASMQSQQQHHSRTSWQPTGPPNSSRPGEEGRRVGREQTVAHQPSSRRHSASSQSQHSSRPGKEGRNAGSERSVSQQPASRQRSASSQRIIKNVVDFDPLLSPNPSLLETQDNPQRIRPREEQGELRFSIGGIDTTPTPRREEISTAASNGGRAYNDEGIFILGENNNNSTTTIDQEEKKMNYSGQRLMMGESSVDDNTFHSMSQPNVNSYDRDSNKNKYNGDGATQKVRSKTFHGMPPCTSSTTATNTHTAAVEQPRRKSLTSGISAEALMNFARNHFDKSTENLCELEQLERALMDQVARLSLGSVEAEVSEGDLKDEVKFSVLREVVKLYMNKEKALQNDDDNNKQSSAEVVKETKNSRLAEEQDAMQKQGDGESSPKRVGSELPQIYNLGDEGRRRDMIKDDDKDVALMRIASLQPEDGAFIRRTTGKWTYAKVKNVASDSIAFIVNANGSSKAYNVKYWVSHIRTLKAPPAAAIAPTQQRNSPTTEDNNNDPGGRRGAFAKQLTESRFSIKNLRPSTPSDDDDDDEED